MKKITKIFALLAIGFSMVSLSSCDGNKKPGDNPITTRVPVSSISFALEKTELDINQTTNIINVTVNPDNATNKNVYFSVSDQTVLSLQDYTVKAVGFGSAYVTAFSIDNPSATYKVRVDVAALHVETVSLSINKTSIEVDESAIATVELFPEIAQNRDYILIANPSNAVRIVDNKITGLKTGIVSIKAKSLEAGIESNTVSLEVKEATARGIVISSDKTELKIGETTNLTYVVTPSYARDKEVTIKTQSGTNNVISISASNVVTANGIGEDYIVISMKNKPEVWNRIKFTVTETPVTKINLYASTTVIKVDDEITLTPEVLPSNATYKSIGYKTGSGNSNIISVNQSGVVKGISVGSDSVICYSVKNPSVYAEITFEVGEKPFVPVTGLNLSSSKTDIALFEEVNLTVEILPNEATTKAVMFSTGSGNNNIIEISNNGVVKGVGEGQDSVICKSVSNPSISKEITFKVTEIAPTSINAETSIQMTFGTPYQINASCVPSNASYKDLSYKVVERTSYSGHGDRFESSEDYEYYFGTPKFLTDIINIDLWFDNAEGNPKIAVMLGQGWEKYFGYYDIFSDGTLGDDYSGVSISKPSDGKVRVTFDLSKLNKLSDPETTNPDEFVDMVYIRGGWSTASGSIKVDPTLKPDILSVDSNGLITATGVGEQTIKVFNTKYPSIYKDIRVEVKSNPSDPVGEDVYNLF